MERHKKEKMLSQELLNTITTYVNNDTCEDLESKHTPCSLAELWKEYVKRNSDSI